MVRGTRANSAGVEFDLRSIIIIGHFGSIHFVGVWRLIFSPALYKIMVATQHSTGNDLALLDLLNQLIVPYTEFCLVGRWRYYVRRLYSHESARRAVKMNPDEGLPRSVVYRNSFVAIRRSKT